MRWRFVGASLDPPPLVDVPTFSSSLGGLAISELRYQPNSIDLGHKPWFCQFNQIRLKLLLAQPEKSSRPPQIGQLARFVLALGHKKQFHESPP